MRRTATIAAALVVLFTMAVPAVAKTDRIAFSGEELRVDDVPELGLAHAGDDAEPLGVGGDVEHGLGDGGVGAGK
ncbi:MAG: hypothetical protein R6W83_05370, partial [Cryobacterium sp.]